MTSRDKVFENIRNALRELPVSERASYPDWDDSLAVSTAHPQFPSTWDLFVHRCAFAGATAIDGLEALIDLLKERELTVGYCAPEIASMLEPRASSIGVRLETHFDRNRFDDYAFGITWASAVIVETGSIVLKDQTTSSRLGALAPWFHIAVVRASDVLPDTPSSIKRFGDDPNIIWVTGPSKTADVEGILIEGVHGPGVQICCRIPD